MVYTKQPGQPEDVTMQVVTQSLSVACCAMQWEASLFLVGIQFGFFWRQQIFLCAFIRQDPLADQSPKNRIPDTH